MLLFYSGMPTFLMCPEIARRIGYSRMHVTRLAKQGRIPDERMKTKGGQRRYELTPQLAEWIRVMRRRPRHGKVLDTNFYVLGCWGPKKPLPRTTDLIFEEMLLLTREIRYRVQELKRQNPSAEDMLILGDTLHSCASALLEEFKQARGAHPDEHFDKFMGEMLNHSFASSAVASSR